MQLDDLRDNDEMDMSDDERDAPRSAKRVKLDNKSLLVKPAKRTTIDEDLLKRSCSIGRERQLKVRAGLVPQRC